MEDPSQMEDLTNLPAMLAARAASTPEEPWLFHRRDWDWHWLSWSQAAHQAALAARELRRSGTMEQAGGRIACAARFEPDSIVTALAILAAGGVVAAGAELRPVPPPAPSRLGRWTPDLESLRARRRKIDPVFGERTGEDLARTVDRWRELLPPASPKHGGRSIVLASAAADRATWEVLVAWTLRTGAAWVLEADKDAFVTAILRNRPTTIVSPGAEAGLAALSVAEPSHRRWHRLRAVGVTDDAPAEIVHREAWEALGVPVVLL